MQQVCIRSGRARRRRPQIPQGMLQVQHVQQDVGLNQHELP